MTPARDRTAAPGESLYRLLLHLYPRSFRAEYGEAIVGFYRQRLAEARPAAGARAPGRLAHTLGLSRLLLRLHADLVVHALAERYAPLPSRAVPALASALWPLASDAASDLWPLTSPSMLTLLKNDIAYALRTLRRSPAFTAAVLLTLALGIGANVAMFSMANLALFRALPYHDADRLVLGRTQWPSGGISWNVSAPDYYDVRDQAKSFESIGVITPFTDDVTLTGAGDAQRVEQAWASPGFFRTLGVAPQMGREFLPAEGEPGGAGVALISHDFWQTRLGGRPDVLGTTITLNGAPNQVVGVMPPGFAFRNDVDLWVPMVRGEGFATVRQYHNWLVVARLAPGVTVDAARAEVSGISRRLEEEYPATNKGMSIVISPLRETMVASFRPSLYMFMGAVGLMLLIACGNVAGLLLARGSARSTEMALRSALGAGRGRLVRQLLTESAALGIGAGVLGSAVAVVAQRTLVSATPLTRMGLQAAGIQPAVLLFALVLSLGTVLVFGLVPALAASNVSVAEALKSGTRSLAGERGRLRSALVVVQVALSLVLLVSSGLLVRSFLQLRGVNPGFDAHGLLTADIGLPRVGYEDAARRNQFFDTFLARVRSMPGVDAAALSSALPLRDQGGNIGVWNPSHPPANASEVRLSYERIVKPGYFQTMGIPIRRGRDVRPTDTPGAPNVMVINETMAKTLFDGENPVGREVVADMGGGNGTRIEVVGVVGDVHTSGLGDVPEMAMYLPYEQQQRYTMRLVARSKTPTALIRPLRRLLAELEPNVPLADARTMDQVLSASMSFTRTVMNLLVAFGALALLLTSIGLYGVLAFFVARRSREIGIRMALGARSRDVFGLILGRGFALVAAGLALGVFGALAATRLLSGFLFDVGAKDPVTFVSVSLFLVLVTLLACLIPAWRAWRVDPVEAFRTE